MRVNTRRQVIISHAIEEIHNTCTSWTKLCYRERENQRWYLRKALPVVAESAIDPAELNRTHISETPSSLIVFVF